MNSTKKIVLSVVALPLMLGSASVLAHGKKDHHHGAKGAPHQCYQPMERRVFNKLELTDVQKNKLKALRKTSHAAMKADREAHRADNMAERKAHDKKMQALLLANNFDKSAAMTLVKKELAKKAERKVTDLEQFHEMFNVLTADQKQKYTQIVDKRTERCMKKQMKKHEAKQAKQAK